MHNGARSGRKEDSGRDGYLYPISGRTRTALPCPALPCPAQLAWPLYPIRQDAHCTA